LNNLELKQLTEELIDTFLIAGKVSKDFSAKGLKITIKPDKSPVTDGDLEVDKILREKILNLTPNIPIISEETVDFKVENKNKIFWLVDPIDGTRQYIKNEDEYTLNAALIINLKPTIGLIYAPKKDRLFFSYGKNLAFEISNGNTKILNCKKVNTNEIIALTNSDKMSEKVLQINKEHNSTLLTKMASSLKFCVLAAGEADIYAAEARAFEWDIAAGHAILLHSGGSVTTHDGEDIIYGKKNYKNLSLIAKRSSNLIL
jgi:3'(2'), 5'-bisphosphate nucleotidase|tara:strand:+ start:1487 stop:2263 length:777 start_codon:yes stop_codon:yes gene_type:complete